MRYLISILSTLFLLQPVYGAADGGFEKCRDMSNDKKRLRCYDKLADQLAQPLHATTKETLDPDVDAVKSVASTQAEAFGQREPARRDSEHITASIAQLDASAFGKLIIKLDNAQTWVQLDSSRVFLQAGDNVTIRTSSLQSFQLRKASGGKSIRVKRVD